MAEVKKAEDKKAKDITKKPTQADIDAGLALLAKKIERQEKISRGEIKGSKKWSEKTEEEKTKMRVANKRRQAKQAVIIQKALAQGITASDKEIEEYMAAKSA